MFCNLKKLSQSLYAAFINDYIAPPFCAGCKDFLKVPAIFCKACNDKITPLVSKSLKINKQYTVNVFAVSGYQDPLKSLILAKSFRDITACSLMGELIYDHTYFKNIACDYLVPVPLHWIRHARRGYNQAHEIAKVLSVKRSVQVMPLVKRNRYTPFQSSIPLADRMNNVSGIFQLVQKDYSHLANKHLVIVDDLMTTGSTILQVAKTLLPLKPASINAIVVARAI